MAKALVIVESPAKTKTINKFLGNKFKVTSSMGHLIDLPKSTLGVDVENEFEPKLIVVRDKSKILKQLKKDAKTKDEIYIATDPDREGEAIGWNIVQHIGEGKTIYRVVFHEITKDAVLKAFKNKREFDMNKINAQMARRILDRIVGYQISPILWKKVGSRLSAGRVQSVALRLIVEREMAIRHFTPQEYWQISVDVQKQKTKEPLTAQLEKIKGKKFELTSESQAQAIVKELESEQFSISKITERETRRNAQPPFITSTLQQEAFGKLNFNASKTMMIAQQLYEGIEVGDGESVGLITYMRTDSVNLSQEAVEKVREFISSEYGAKYLPETPNVYKSKKSAQEAHEAIRPTDVLRNPKEMMKYLTDDQYKLYGLIWKRFISCQMTPAVYKNKKIEIVAAQYTFGAAGSVLLFDGYLKLYKDINEEDSKVDFAPFVQGDILDAVQLNPTQHFTKPPPRYSEASIVKTLEEQGIGRPSTYASIIGTLVMRNYVQRDRGYFMATELGILICDLLVENFDVVMDVGFTAQMEERLDLVEEGKLDHRLLLKEFYEPFSKRVAKANENITKTELVVDKECPDCKQANLVVKWGRNGRFLSCSRFPDCKHAEPYTTGIVCSELPEHVCPAGKDKCDGELVERRSRRGSKFYGCTQYPDCTFIVNKLPSDILKRMIQSVPATSVKVEEK